MLDWSWAAKGQLVIYVQMSEGDPPDVTSFRAPCTRSPPRCHSIGNAMSILLGETQRQLTVLGAR